MDRNRSSITTIIAALGTFCLLAASGAGADEAAVGAPAPTFTLSDLDGKEVALADLVGKVVVLEWYNPECPFVRYAHTKGPLAEMGNRVTDEGIVWLAVNSGAAGKQGHDLETNRSSRKTYGIRYPVLRDEDGAVGRSYLARTTPHMMVIDATGVLVYRGAVDNAPLGDVDGSDVVNYVAKALADLKAGKAVATSETRPYGCSVKYAK